MAPYCGRRTKDKQLISRSSVMSTGLSLNARSITLFVGCTLADLGDREHVVASFAQCKDYGPRAALVGEELHASGFGRKWRVREQHHFLVGHARGAIGDSRPDVLGRQMR